jgi:hypothetical protein
LVHTHTQHTHTQHTHTHTLDMDTHTLTTLTHTLGDMGDMDVAHSMQNVLEMSDVSNLIGPWQSVFLFNEMQLDNIECQHVNTMTKE